MKNNNILTIFRKECARFFGDKSLVFTGILMPGLLIFLIYNLMGKGIEGEINDEMERSMAEVQLYAENMPAEIVPLFDSLPILLSNKTSDTAAIFNKIRNNEENVVFIQFPEDVLARLSNPEAPIQQVSIFYNSSNPAASSTYYALSDILASWENSKIDLFDINTDQSTTFDCVQPDDIEDEFGDIFSKLIPMLILMMLFSACMTVAPTAIAGEKERGTIATLLVTPLKRKELAWGKILSLSLFALLSGLSTFAGIMLSLPKMLHSDEISMGNLANISGYGWSDYITIFVVIITTVLIMISIISVLSAFAKDTKSAGTIVMPFMLVVMGVGLSPLLIGGGVEALWASVIPLFNSVQCMSCIFAHTASVAMMALTMGSNIVYTLIAVWVLEKMFNSERIMFGK